MVDKGIDNDNNGWSSIDTAPKDGTIIDVYLGNSSEEMVKYYCCPYTKIAHSWHYKNGGYRPALGLENITPCCNEIPTHWRPKCLPPIR